MENIIEIKDLEKRYKRKISNGNGIKSIFKKNKHEEIQALKSISFSISKGEIVGLVGLNGAGKSTTIKLLTGILHPDNGVVKVLGRDSYKYRKKNAKSIGVMFGQRSHLLFDLPFRNSLELLKKIYSVSESDYKEVLKRADDYLDINSLLDVPVRTMSLGQRMKCEFTAITLHKPQIFILDEPTIGLDIITRKQIKHYIEYLNKEENITVLLTTHDLSEIEKLCRRVVVLNEGKILVDSQMDHIAHLVDSTFATISINDDEFDSREIEDFGDISILEKNEACLKIKINTTRETSKKTLGELLKLTGVLGVNVHRPNLEEILFYLLEKTTSEGEEESI